MPEDETAPSGTAARESDKRGEDAVESATADESAFRESAAGRAEESDGTSDELEERMADELEGTSASELEEISSEELEGASAEELESVPTEELRETSEELETKTEDELETGCTADELSGRASEELETDEEESSFLDSSSNSANKSRTWANADADIQKTHKTETKNRIGKIYKIQKNKRRRFRIK